MQKPLQFRTDLTSVDTEEINMLQTILIDIVMSVCPLIALMLHTRTEVVIIIIAVVVMVLKIVLIIIIMINNYINIY